MLVTGNMTTAVTIMADIDNNHTAKEMKSPGKNRVSFRENNKSNSDISVSPSDEERRISVGSGGHNGEMTRKRKRRRIKGGRHHRKWKPYDKLTWSEKKALEDKETIRATQKREEAFASGHPVAPYNTTQFLMEDHIQSEASPDLLDVENGEIVSKHRDSYNSDCSSDSEFYADDETFLAKEFSEEYDNIHAERLNTMTKEELVKDYVELERKVEVLEKQLKESNKDMPCADRLTFDGNSLNGNTSGSGEELALYNNNSEDAVKNVGEEMRRLRQDNDVMKKQLEELKKRIGSS